MLVIINFEYPKFLRKFSVIEGGKIIPALVFLLEYVDDVLNFEIAFSASIIAFLHKLPENKSLIALDISLSEIVVIATA